MCVCVCVCVCVRACGPVCTRLSVVFTLFMYISIYVYLNK